MKELSLNKIQRLIFILDDEPDIVELVSINLEKGGYKAKGFTEVKDFMKYIEKIIPDLLILDLMLPEANGFEICKYLRANEKFANIPIIMLTAKADEMDKVLGFELGTDDYMTKPFSTRELVSRVNAVLKRTYSAEGTRIIKIGNRIIIDTDKYEVFVDGKQVELTHTEYKILRLLSERKGWVYSRGQIIDYIGGDDDKYILDRTVDVHIKNMRDKLGDAGAVIKNKRGIGYKIEEKI